MKKTFIVTIEHSNILSPQTIENYVHMALHYYDHLAMKAGKEGTFHMTPDPIISIMGVPDVEAADGLREAVLRVQIDQAHKQRAKKYKEFSPK